MPEYKRILVTRTDRVGDVLLTTPALKALRVQFPKSYIAVITRPYTKDILIGNPFIDEVIVYDKYGSERNFFKTVLFALSLRKKNFDVAFMLHPTNRVHLIAFIAGIKKRIGFDRKLSFLLTDTLVHKKQEGKMHERDYTLDAIAQFGVAPVDKSLFMPISNESETRIEAFLNANGLSDKDVLVALHPGASCPSKRWHSENFAQLADSLIKECGVKIILIAGPDDISTADEVLGSMKERPVNAAGKTTISDLASLLRRCKLFISNDSGPVHISSALGVPVIALFGRSQPGLGFRRWGPTGTQDVVVYHDVGCEECLAHNCQKDFSCLKAISVEEVLRKAKKLL